MDFHVETFSNTNPFTKKISICYTTHDCSNKCVQWTGKSEIYADNSAQNKKINQWCECDCDHIISKVHNFPEKKNGEFFLAE